MIIRESTDGLLVPPEDTWALAEAMEKLITDEGKRVELGNEARNVTSRYSLEQVMSKWEEVVFGLVQ